MPSGNFIDLKESGNQHFRQGEFESAINNYHRALELTSNNFEKLSLHKNLAAAFLQLNQFKEALDHANNALEIDRSDEKALFRKIKAQQGLKQYRAAFQDALVFQKMCSNSSLIQSTLRELSKEIEEISTVESALSNRINQTLDQLKNSSSDIKIQVANNLLALVKERAATKILLEKNILDLIKKILSSKGTVEIKLALVRTLSEICNHGEHTTKKVLEIFQPDELVDLIISELEEDEQIAAVQYLIQAMITSLTSFNPNKKSSINKDLFKNNEEYIDSLLSILVQKCSSRVLSGLGRDAILQLLSTNLGSEALNWGKTLLLINGLYHLLEVASELEDIKHESNMNITSSTKGLVAITLERVYASLDSDKLRDEYRKKVMEYINDKLISPDIESKIRATAVIATLLSGPIDVGNHCLSQQGVIEMMLAMAGSDNDPIQQRVAADAIILAASKKDKCTSIASMGSGILKKLYQSSNEQIRVRGLVGLCKLGSIGGDDASFRLYSDASLTKLTNACKEILSNPNKEKDLKKWAAEGLAYLTMDADVKEDIASDPKTLGALVNLAQCGDSSAIYGVLTTIVNLTNSYDKKEILPEMIELAKFAKQHIPKEHPKDAKEFIDKRCYSIVENNVTLALVALSSTESPTSREMLCRVFNAICEHVPLRGKVVAQGGVRVLLKMASGKITVNGKIHACHALARIGITLDPKVAFPGERCAEVVRPIMTLLNIEYSALQNFEALMALTNLAQVNPTIRTKILEEQGFSKIEHYLYEEHTMLRRAATQCVANLITHPTVVELFEGKNDRLKFLLFSCEEKDLETAKAAAGGIAMLTSESITICKKVVTIKDWLTILMHLCGSTDLEIMHRGVYLVYNLVASDKKVAEKIVETPLFEVLVAIIRPEVDDIGQEIKNIAQEALKYCQKYKIIKANEE